MEVVTCTPVAVQWYLTKRCNLTCAHCYNYGRGELPAARARELTREEAFLLIDKLTEWGVYAVNFLGGEVLAVPWFVELAARGVAAGLRVMVATNGTLITDQVADALARGGVRDFQISLDGGRDRHDAVRGQGTFDRAISGLRALVRRGFWTRIAFTLMNANKDGLAEVLQVARAEGVAAIKLNAFIPSGRSSAQRAQIPATSVTRAAVDLLLEAARMSEGRLTLELPCFIGHIGDEETRNHWRMNDNPRGLRCGAGATSAVIWEDGSVSACDFVREPVGDLRNQTLSDIWNARHESIERWRRLERMQGTCGTCGYRAACGFGCRANAYLAGGDFYGYDPGCISDPPPGVEHPLAYEGDRAATRQSLCTLPAAVR